MQSRPPLAAYLALAALCFFWGTVYLGIRIALEYFPPMLLMGGRFFYAGLATLLAGAAFGAKMPSLREFGVTAFNGIITLGLGIGTLAFAEQWVPSGLAAILTTTSPFWMIGIAALFPGHERPNAKTLFGILAGLAGTLLLVVPGAMHEGLGGAVFSSFLILQVGCGGFALGSILERRHQTTTHPVINAAIQELATGLVFLIPGLLMHHDPVKWSFRGIAAVAYLVVFGGIVGYSSFIYAMKHLPVALVSIYTYVNPVVAVLIGALLYSEKFSGLDIAAMIIVMAGVAVVRLFSGRAVSTSAAAA
ncbi:MAG TPA: EamA family transporter [Bryobacteraceae bacterium]|jgi:drug/metabolite transporter (DMT)-like permease|nr:EamA family transporter [Bryobacteraceae bacterium]